MSDSSVDEYTCGEDSEDAQWVLYRDRDEWNDVTPIAQDDGPYPVVAIDYSEKFKDCYDYLRAVLVSGEKSDRTLGLTEDCICLNPANYTVWQYRREILKELGKDLREELKYIDKMIKNNSKHYQVWYHRKVIVEWLQDPTEELEFTEMILEKDAKNYHAWQHRQWCMKTFNLFDNELEYIERLLNDDIRNNSAWNQRYFVINNTTKFEQDVIDREIDYALEKIEAVKGNESAWNYLRGILMHDKDGLGSNEKVRRKCQELYNRFYHVRHVLACIIDICQENPISSEPIDSIFHIKNALKMCSDLAERHDKIRNRYWEFVRRELEDKIKSEAN